MKVSPVPLDDKWSFTGLPTPSTDGHGTSSEVLVTLTGTRTHMGFLDCGKPIFVFLFQPKALLATQF